MADPVKEHPDQAKLPPGFVVVPSSSRPGQVSYLDQTTQKKYMTVQQTWEIFNERGGSLGSGEGAGGDSILYDARSYSTSQYQNARKR